MFEKIEPLELIFKVLEAVLLIVGFKEVSEAKTKEDKRDAILQHFPKLFGFGRSDEAIWCGNTASLDKEYRGALTKVIEKLSESEKTSFILTVALIPNDISSDKNGAETSAAEYSQNDQRIKFLKALVEDANMCKEDSDVEKAVAYIRANHLATGSNLSALQEGMRWQLFNFLDISSWEELSDEKLSQAIKRVTATIKTYRQETHRQRGSIVRFTIRLFGI